MKKEYGRIKIPVFKIVGWETKGVFADGEVVDNAPGKAAPAKPATASSDNRQRQRQRQ